MVIAADASLTAAFHHFAIVISAMKRLQFFESCRRCQRRSRASLLLVPAERNVVVEQTVYKSAPERYQNTITEDYHFKTDTNVPSAAPSKASGHFRIVWWRCPFCYLPLQVTHLNIDADWDPVRGSMSICVLSAASSGLWRRAHVTTWYLSFEVSVPYLCAVKTQVFCCSIYQLHVG